MESGKALKRTL